MKAFKFRIVADTEEDIFRDIIIREDDTFEQLYKMIIKSVGFRGDQMASFYMSNEEWEKGEEISLMDMSFGDTGPRMMDTTLLNEMIFNKNDKVLFLYDFMKMWIFYVELIGIDEAKEDQELPAIVLSMGQSPNEDEKEIPDLFEAEFSEKAGSKSDEFDDIFSEFDDDMDDDFGRFENIDDLDI